MSVEPSRGNVLVIAETPEDGGRLVRWVEAAGERAVLLAGAERFLIDRGDDESVDLVVTDLDTDEPRARELIERMLAGTLFPDVPQLHVVRDLAFRERMARLGPTIAAVAVPFPPEAGIFQARVRLAAEVGRLRRELQRGSMRDAMTGLFNRRFVLLRLEQELSRARRHGTPLTLILVDIDGLRRINARYGEETGDRAIREVAGILVRQVRKEDVLGRIGEESFAVLLPGARFRGGATLAGNVRTDVEATALECAGGPVELRVSAGVATFPTGEGIDDPEALLRRAEAALAEAKRRGGNRVHVDEEAIHRGGAMLLVVDADPDLLDLAEDLLATDDHLVVRAADAADALAAVAERPPSLLILDLQTPATRPGLDLLEEIRARHPRASFPVIGLSRESEGAPREPARAGIDRLITKPFSVSVLRSLARELLRD